MHADGNEEKRDFRALKIIKASQRFLSEMPVKLLPFLHPHVRPRLEAKHPFPVAPSLTPTAMFLQLP